MAAPPKEDLDSVFGEGAPAETMPSDLPPADDDMAGGDEEALDMAIDEAFDAKDPAVRREAFKNAVRMCGQY
jgi:hypothetical protein